MFEDSYRVVMSMKNKDLFKTRLYVKFAGETGLDYGGLSRLGGREAMTNRVLLRFLSFVLQGVVLPAIS